MVKLHVEYCGGCGYKPRFDELERQIKLALPDTEISSVSGRTASFEVTIDDQLVFSKLEKGAFPDFQEIVDMVKNASEGGQVGQIEGTQPSCIIL